MENKRDNINKLEDFFNYDLKVKKIINDIIPIELDFYNDESRIRYVDRLLKGIHKIKFYISKMMTDYNLPSYILNNFNNQIEYIKLKINSKEFYNLLKEDYISFLKIFNNYITNMRVEFIESVKKGLIGYYIFYGDQVLPPVTINEFLHYTHSYIINSNSIYKSVPTIKTNKDNLDNSTIINLRGISNQIGNDLYEKLTKTNLFSSCIDIINLEKKTLIMARDLGHATVIEIDIINENNIFVRYFIPKNTNMRKCSELKGINENKKRFANGSFQTTKETVIYDICNLMQSIPTDRDIEEINFNISKR